MTARKLPMGRKHHRWNTGQMRKSDGHVRIRVGKTHPLADRNGYTTEHLLVWVAAGNARPPRGQILHHKDEDKTNNRIDNLELLTRARHCAIHNATKRRDRTGRFLPESQAKKGRAA